MFFLAIAAIASMKNNLIISDEHSKYLEKNSVAPLKKDYLSHAPVDILSMIGSFLNTGGLTLRSVSKAFIFPIQTLVIHNFGNRKSDCFDVMCGIGSDDVLSVMKNLQLHYLDITNCTKVIGGLKHLAKMPLHTLHAGSCPNILNGSFQYLHHIQFLDVSYSKISNVAMAHIGKMPLQTLNIDGNRKITNRGISHLTNCESLRILHMVSCDIDDGMFEYLHDMSLGMLFASDYICDSKEGEIFHNTQPDCIIIREFDKKRYLPVFNDEFYHSMGFDIEMHDDDDLGFDDNEDFSIERHGKPCFD